jgi:hypothetical protein
MSAVVLGSAPSTAELVEAATPDRPSTCAVGRRSWVAIDAEVEDRLDRAARRKPNWRELLFSWLIEFNRY